MEHGGTTHYRAGQWHKGPNGIQTDLFCEQKHVILMTSTLVKLINTFDTELTADIVQACKLPILFLGSKQHQSMMATKSAVSQFLNYKQCLTVVLQNPFVVTDDFMTYK